MNAVPPKRFRVFTLIGASLFVVDASSREAASRLVKWLVEELGIPSLLLED
jgi:hypothetical protein